MLNLLPGAWGTKGSNIQTILGHGPQRKDPEVVRDAVYHDMSVQVETAFVNGDSVILIEDINVNLVRLSFQRTSTPCQITVNSFLHSSASVIWKLKIYLCHETEFLLVYININRIQRNLFLIMFLFHLVWKNSSFLWKLMRQKTSLHGVHWKGYKVFWSLYYEVFYDYWSLWTKEIFRKS